MLRERADDLLWSDKEILRRLRRLLMAKGRLSEGLILKARGMPCPNTLHRHFGSFRQIYEAVGYHLAEEDIFRTEQCERSMRLRRALVSRIGACFLVMSWLHTSRRDLDPYSELTIVSWFQFCCAAYEKWCNATLGNPTESCGAGVRHVGLQDESPSQPYHRLLSIPAYGNVSVPPLLQE